MVVMFWGVRCCVICVAFASAFDRSVVCNFVVIIVVDVYFIWKFVELSVGSGLSVNIVGGVLIDWGVVGMFTSRSESKFIVESSLADVFFSLVFFRLIIFIEWLINELLLFVVMLFILLVFMCVWWVNVFGFINFIFGRSYSTDNVLNLLNILLNVLFFIMVFLKV